MTHLFLKVNKDLFNLGLNPTEILLLSQIMEFHNTTGNCFMSDKAFSAAFGVSEKTISRELKVLEDKGFITRDTKAVRGGKERHITYNAAAVEKALTKDKLTDAECLQQTNCPLTTDNLTFDKGQNDLIKDNLIDKKKDNNCVLLPKGNKTETAASGSFTTNYQKVSKKFLEENNIEYELVAGNFLAVIKATGARVELV